MSCRLDACHHSTLKNAFFRRELWWATIYSLVSHIRIQIPFFVRTYYALEYVHVDHHFSDVNSHICSPIENITLKLNIHQFFITHMQIANCGLYALCAKCRKMVSISIELAPRLMNIYVLELMFWNATRTHIPIIIYAVQNKHFRSLIRSNQLNDVVIFCIIRILPFLFLHFKHAIKCFAKKTSKNVYLSFEWYGQSTTI